MAAVTAVSTSPLLLGRSFRELASEGCLVGARVLMVLTAVLLVVMPWTEYFCNFDRFLRGGQDVELGLLATLTMLLLVLVLFQRARSNILLRLHLRQCVEHLFAPLRMAEFPVCCRWVAELGVLSRLYALPGMANLPFQV